MKIIDAKAEIISEKNPYKKVEMAARTCYKSEANITAESAEKMCKGLIKSQHTAMLEHAVLCFQLEPSDFRGGIYYNYEAAKYLDDISKNRFFHVTCTLKENKARILVSANMRAISERGINDPVFRAVKEQYPSLVWGHAAESEYNAWPEIRARIVDIDDFDDLTDEEIGEHKVLTFRFTTDRGVSHELVRHRPCSFAQESTRYCLYSKDQFGNELTFIRPSTFDAWPQEKQMDYLSTLKCLENCYLRLVSGEDALQAQQARAILSTSIKTEIVVTANMAEWRHIFNLRVHGTTGAPHPDMKYVASQALDIAMQDPLAAKYLG